MDGGMDGYFNVLTKLFTMNLRGKKIMKLNDRNTKSDWSQHKMSMGGVKSERSKISSNLTRFRLDKIQKNIPPLSLICSCFVSLAWCFLRGYSISVPNRVWRQMSGSKSSDGRWWVLVKYWIYYQGSTYNNAHTHTSEYGSSWLCL